MNDARWGSHLVPLAAALGATDGPVLEIGCGHWSTPFLVRYCGAAGRRLLSVEHDGRWLPQDDCLAYYKPDWERIVTPSYDVVLPQLATMKWAVVLLDHWPAGRRAVDALLFRGRAEAILIHDARKAAKHGWLEVLSDWPRRVEHDTIVLNGPPPG